jgi:FAD-dependent oxidoreductase domain-containing protein 1
MMRIIIAGAGIMGLCTAYFLQKMNHKVHITLYEQDISFAKASTHLSAASLRTQFSTAMSIKMSQFGLQEIKAAGLPFVEGGYLYLASTLGEKALRDNHLTQQACGADVQLYAPSELKKRFPFLSCDNVALGAWGQSGEGWFDAALLHAHYKAAAKLKFTQKRVVKLLPRKVELHTGEYEPYDIFINAAGALSAKLMPELPVEPRKRTVFVAKPLKPLPHLPLLIDPCGLWVRPEKEFLLLGGGENPMQDLITQDPPAFDDFEPDYALFDEKLWPRLAQIIPECENLKFIRAWAGHYDYNSFDQNAIIGQMPQYENAYVLTGFSGHGLQHGAAAGRGLAELILTGSYQSLDLSCFSFARILENKALKESNII